MSFDSGFQIEVLEGMDIGAVFPLRSREITLGRKIIRNEKISGWILFNEPTVSRIHAYMTWNETSKCYILSHRSKTNNTMVNNIPVQETELRSGDIMRMGLLLIKITLLLCEAEEKKDVKIDGFSEDIADAKELKTIYCLRIIKGENSGSLFLLSDDRITIGRGKATQNNSEKTKILIDEPELPKEYAYLVLDEKEKKYGIEKNNDSQMISRIRRKSGDFETLLEVSSNKRILLNEGDELILGDSVLLVEKQIIEPECSQKQVTERDLIVFPDEIDPPVLSYFKPARETRTELLKSNTGINDNKSDDEAETFSHSMKDDSSQGWKASGDYELHIASGTDKGKSYELFSGDLQTGRILRLGKKDNNKCDIQINEPGIGNLQCLIVFRDGKFYFRNDYKRLKVIINKAEVPVRRFFLLRSGDRIQIINTVIVFIDRKVKERYISSRLIIMEGFPEIKADIFELAGSKDTYLIGRDPECEIRFSSKEISKIHAAIRLKGTDFLFENLSNSGSIIINGISLLKRYSLPLKPGDQIRLAENCILFFSAITYLKE